MVAGSSIFLLSLVASLAFLSCRECMLGDVMRDFQAPFFCLWIYLHQMGSLLDGGFADGRTFFPFFIPLFDLFVQKLFHSEVHFICGLRLVFALQSCLGWVSSCSA